MEVPEAYKITCQGFKNTSCSCLSNTRDFLALSSFDVLNRSFTPRHWPTPFTWTLESANTMTPHQDVLPQYINPQHTDKFFHEQQFEQCYTTPRVSNGLPSPYLSTPTSDARGLTIDISDEPTCTSKNSPASSMESSGYITPCSLSSASSRRHSLILSESQRCFFSSSNQNMASPTPERRQKRIGSHVELHHSPPSTSFSSYSESLGSTSRSLGHDSFHPGVSSDDILVGVEMYHNKANTIGWQAPNEHSSSFDQGLQIPVQCLSMDLSTGFNASMASSEMDLRRPSIEPPPMHAFHTSLGRQSDTVPTQIEYMHLPTLAEPFEPISPLSDRSTRSPSPPVRSSRQRRRSGLSTVRRHKPSKKTEPAWRATFSTHLNNNSHKCAHCNNSFKRPEHLKRHERKHLPAEQTVMLPCVFSECNRKIKDRSDNMRAHLQVTHFKYGKSERSGKNIRFSMKDSMNMNLRSEDLRWTLLLEGGIRFGDAENGYWKMLGYSIKETQEIKVKDLIPEWEGPDDITLKKFDPRWIKLLEGDMSFEQAMETGRWMPEEEKEGLLGVDMMSSKEMGLQDIDPRWKRLLDGSMSIENSERLGVKHLNPSAVGQQRVQTKSKH